MRADCPQKEAKLLECQRSMTSTNSRSSLFRAFYALQPGAWHPTPVTSKVQWISLPSRTLQRDVVGGRRHSCVPAHRSTRVSSPTKGMRQISTHCRPGQNKSWPVVVPLPQHRATWNSTSWSEGEKQGISTPMGHCRLTKETSRPEEDCSVHTRRLVWEKHGP